ncbi:MULTISPECIES: universal stress protein [unclassified Microbacterium]|uniref:universal stress protein n=1 Tax=unclassified Microbacterium TaxID=2609290 RepID=UPI00214C3C8F|nr:MULTISPECIES: universal stress protein [unclassified Microbacterium]MCR2810377.1 universal stress protein [Microbacterium sp. zg.B185]WIM18434.1 universal stress protein [Microbacterium sp. zg-B185]
MSGRIVVGYTATDAGEDAVALGARLAAASGSGLDVVVVLPSDGRSVITPPDASYDRYLRDKAAAWLDAAASGVPEGTAVTTNVRYADSFAEGLEAAAQEFGATHIVVGAANGGRRGRHRLGSVATELLHSSSVPVVLAPEGSRRVDPAIGVTRVTAAIGTRPGADALLHEATSLAEATGAELRLLSLVTVDLPASVDTGVIRIAGAAHADEVLARARAALANGGAAEAVVARGDSIEDAVQNLSWEPGELAIVASSRLAQPRRLFLGSTAAKMLHELPVPMIVVPRTRTAEGASR